MESALTGIAGPGNPSNGGISTFPFTGSMMGVARLGLAYVAFRYSILEVVLDHFFIGAKVLIGCALFR